VNIVIILGALAKIASFGFAEALASCVGAKPNVLPKAFGMWLAKIE